ncbi:hypothetical protein [Dokdonella sp.]|uniref:hypothetical protein n=1 Tax=Dokdonella sp. TaxID=2291710 RepID=UPI0035283D33
MPANFNAEEFDTALRQLKQAAPAVAPSAPSSEPIAAGQWQQSEKFRVRVITARTKLKLMRDRSEALRDSLKRFRDQQACANRA